MSTFGMTAHQDLSRSLSSFRSKVPGIALGQGSTVFEIADSFKNPYDLRGNAIFCIGLLLFERDLRILWAKDVHA
jgi:hypothetical protein